MSNELRLGELCAGYGGLGMAVEEVFDATTAWFSEFDAAPSKILAHHWPDVPNYGDMTKIDWAAIEPVDIISGGTPCQDLSAAGRRAGMNEGTRSNLWVQMRESIAIQRPRYVVWENVRGAYSAEASSDLEHCPGCMGDAADRGTVLRALGRVLGDLSDLGYDCQWRGLRAADVGACHGRFRVFVLARIRNVRDTNSADVEGQWPGRFQISYLASESRERGSSSADLADAYRLGYERGWEARGRRLGLADSSEPAADSDNPGRGEQRRAESEGIIGRLAAAGDRASTADTLRSGSGRRATESEPTGGNNAPIGSSAGGTDAVANAGSSTIGEQAGGSLAEEAWTGSRNGSGDHHGERPATNWGPYEPAIRRWEARLGRPAPRPTEPTGRNGGERLSPRFTEWMMGLPDGWVTDPDIGISRNEQLKACGNGVVPQQAMAALRDMLATFQSQQVAA